MIGRVKEAVRNSGLYSRVRAELQLVTQPAREQRVAVCPGDDYPGSAGDLRGVAIARCLKNLGWQTLWFPVATSAEDRQAWLRRFQPHVVLFQQTRHPLNDPSLYPGHLCVLDVDDADIVRPQVRDHVIAVARGCHTVIAGSDHLASLFRPYNPRVHVVWTGTYLRAELGAPPNRMRPATLAWSQTTPLHYPKEAELVRWLVLRLAKRLSERLTLQLYDSQHASLEELLAPLKAAGVLVRTLPRLRYPAFQATLGQVAIGLHPVVDLEGFSQGKSFGKILNYINAGAACVVSNALDYPKFLRTGENGMLASGPEEWVEICAHLLENPEERHRMTEQALQDLRLHLTTEAAAAKVSGILAGVVADA